MVTFDQAKEVSQTLAAKVSPIALIVFGTVATKGQGNDLDLLVITTQENMYETIGCALEDFYSRFAVDYFVTSVTTLTKQFREGSPFLRLIQREGRILYMDPSFRAWSKIALEDLEQAKYLFQGAYYRGACFNAQRAVEKALKGELIDRGWELERIHSLRRLLSLAKSYDLHLEWEGKDIDFLDSIYRGRYPAEEGLLPLGELSREDASRALGIAESLVGQLRLTKEKS